MSKITEQFIRKIPKTDLHLHLDGSLRLPTLIGTLPLLPMIDSSFLDALGSMRPSHWAAVAYLSLMSTVLGFFIWNFALKHMPATSVASFIYLNPPFAAAFGWVLWGEDISIFFLFGSAIILFGLYLAQGKNNCYRQVK